VDSSTITWPYSDQVTFALSLRYDLLRGLGQHASNRRQKLPLIGIRIEGRIDENTVAQFERDEREVG
jgi:hypothetical protein